MEQKEVKEFIYFFTHNKSLTRAQQHKRDALLTRDCIVVKGTDTTQMKDSPSTFKPLSALDTARFFSLFNSPMGLKYLTHDFDTDNDGRPQSLDALYAQVKEILDKKKYSIPFSLWTLVNNYVIGKNWLDVFGNTHNSYIDDPLWKNWSSQTGMHPINNPLFSKEIMAFRSTVRLVPPLLKDICDKAQKGLSLNVKEEKLEKADFYTNTYLLYIVIKRILTMMNRRANKCPEVTISFKRATDTQGRMLRQIVISQRDSFADKTIDDVKERLVRNNEAGDFGAIRNQLNGYCLWQVDTLWDDQPYRWNLLKTEDMPETEHISNDSVIGFTHTLTYFLV